MLLLSSTFQAIGASNHSILDTADYVEGSADQATSKAMFSSLHDLLMAPILSFDSPQEQPRALQITLQLGLLHVVMACTLRYILAKKSALAELTRPRWLWRLSPRRAQS